MKNTYNIFLVLNFVSLFTDVVKYYFFVQKVLSMQLEKNNQLRKNEVNNRIQNN